MRENGRGIALMTLSALAVAVGQLFWKASAGNSLPLLGAGFVLYGVGAMLMVLAFKYGKLSVVHPVLSVSYVFGTVFGYFFLGECLRAGQFAAIVLIMAGVVAIGVGHD